ncbi:putative NUDIX hydrolase domain-containing protein [Helianthus annuus]|nr:putative NUDIX hydrolase domain-containing protein [Helianthus annuus]
MVSSPNRDDMVFPKGGWESDETVEEAACREALEEAGVRGILDVGCLYYIIVLANALILVTNVLQLRTIDQYTFQGSIKEKCRW